MMDRTVLVTGASKGIGQAIAQRLARDGYHIVVHYRSDRAGAEATLAAVRAACADARATGIVCNADRLVIVGYLLIDFTPGDCGTRVEALVGLCVTSPQAYVCKRIAGR